MTKYFERDIAALIHRALHQMPVVVITGMRQTGKTTFLQKQPDLGHRRYVTLDDFSQREIAKLDPDRFVNSDDPLTIDEAQKCPEIFIAIKKAVDKKRKPGHYLLSGSANYLLLKNMTESLAGRSIYFEMHPFSRREIVQKVQKEPFLESFFKNPTISKSVEGGRIKTEEMIIGGMPTVCLEEIQDKSLWFQGYEQTYLERDLREISQIEHLTAFRNLLHLTAMRTGQLLSPSQLGRDAKLSAATTSRYLSLLEASFIITRIHSYLGNRASRLIKSPKIYLSDSGLASFFAGIDRLEPDISEPMIGAIFETYIAQNLLSIVHSRWPNAKLYFWSLQGRHEVDFVIESGQHCLALEIKSNTRWQERDLSSLKAFLSTTPHCKAAILGYNGKESAQIGDRLWVLPLSLILS